MSLHLLMEQYPSPGWDPSYVCLLSAALSTSVVSRLVWPADLVCPAYTAAPAPAPSTRVVSSAGRKLLQA